MKKRRKNIYILLPFVFLLLVLYLFGGDTMASAFSLVAHSRVANIIRYSHPVTALSHFRTTVNLKKDLQSAFEEWQVFHDQGYTDGSIDNVPMPGVASGNVLKVSLLSGQPYAGIHAYRNLPPADSATTFHMHIRFFFPSKGPIQALEFTMNKWTRDVRWEWALQWQAVPDGSALQGSAQSWRVWDGAHWIEIHQQQALDANAWHTLDLYGTIVNGQVHYQRFQCDNKQVNMQQYTYAPISSAGDRLAVGVQLDGNATQQPYSAYFDQINLQSQ